MSSDNVDDTMDSLSYSEQNVGKIKKYFLIILESRDYEIYRLEMCYLLELI